MKKNNKPKNPITKRPSKNCVKIYNSIFFYFPYLFKEMLISSLEVAKLILTPKKIDPKIIEIKTKIDSKMGKVILANSITLTPGTFTIDIEKDRLIIHYLVGPKDEEENQMEKKIRGFLC